tara:strand:- start:9943 stop:11094 length:1152 start_codon:yes stop_codon:yes gene_type:complete
MDLFNPKFSEEQLHSYFIRLISEKKYEPVKSVIESWASGMDGRKGEWHKFIKEFQTTFNSSLWELYLNKAFKDLGFKIDYSEETPDFSLISRAGKVVNVEAVTTNNQRNRDKLYYKNETIKKFTSQNEEEFMDESTIKLLGKIRDKRDLFIGKNGKKHPYSSLKHVKNNPFVIAVAPFDNHISFAQNNVAINKVLFGIERPKMDQHGQFFSKKVSHIVNKNGAELELGIFTNDSYKEISAVIFSTTGMFGKAVIQSKIDTTIRATRYREYSIKKFLSNKRQNKLGVSTKKMSKTHTIDSMRLQIGNLISGPDIHTCHTSEWHESHIDGLHIYYNPYADVKLERNLFNSFQITQNSFDINNNCSVQNHPDGSLVSRQVFTCDNK